MHLSGCCRGIIPLILRLIATTSATLCGSATSPSGHFCVCDDVRTRACCSGGRVLPPPTLVSAASGMEAAVSVKPRRSWRRDVMDRYADTRLPPAMRIFSPRPQLQFRRSPLFGGAASGSRCAFVQKRSTRRYVYADRANTPGALTRGKTMKGIELWKRDLTKYLQISGSITKYLHATIERERCPWKATDGRRRRWLATD